MSASQHSSLLWVVCLCCFCLFGTSSAQPTEGSGDAIFEEDCDPLVYYQRFEGSETSTWTLAELRQLLWETHRRSLPYTSSTREDVWDALIDLDASSDDPNAVHLIYRDADVPSAEFGTTWNREHLWPRSRGIGDSGPDHTDIHALRPADWNVNSARSNLFFGDCLSECTSRPATPEAAEDTAKNGDVFLPPVSVRGDIARALMYMATRYSAATSSEEEDFVSVLELTDCPDRFISIPPQMAYLSELLEWHWEDLPDDQERMRNDRACSRWQGNRNPFVDHPELATVVFGVSASRPYECPVNSPPSSPLPVQEPTNSPISNPQVGCAGLTAGDIQVVAFNSDNPDSVTLVALADLPSGFELYMTDSAWTGSDFQSNEGTVMLQVPSEGISQGQTFGYGQDSSIAFSNDWISIGSEFGFALAIAGESVILYCKSTDETIVPLGAFTTGVWKEESSGSFSTNESALPSSLQLVGSTQTESNFNNYVYTGILAGTRSELLVSLGDPANWVGSNSERQNFVGQFSVLSISPATGCSDLVAGDVQVVAFNSANPDSVTLVALADVPPGFELYMTDNAWTGYGFQSNEGTVMLRVPAGGISQGQTFGYGQDSSIAFYNEWISISGGSGFSLAMAGESIILYCKSTATRTGDGSIFPLGAFTTGQWKEESLESFSTNESALPSSLRLIGSIETLSNLDNYVYAGIRTGTKSELLVALGDERLWEGSNSERQNFIGEFSVLSKGGGSPPSSSGSPSEDGVQDGDGTMSPTIVDDDLESVDTSATSAGPCNCRPELVLALVISSTLFSWWGFA